jgi:hypothetical protein
MSLTRAQLAANLWGTLQRQFTEVGIENTDDSGNLKEPVDSTLLALGVDYSDLETAVIADGGEQKALIVARRYGYEAILDAAATWVDLTIDAPNTSVKRSQFVQNIERALARATADAAPFIDTGASVWGFGSLPIGHITPVCTTEDSA